MFTGEPWVRWPPAARSRPMKVSPGCSSARNTAWFIWLPEFGCTLAKLAPNSFLARSNREVLGNVDPLTTAVIARARIALCVLVGHHRTLRFQHGTADDVLGGDQLDLMALTAELALDGGRDFRISPPIGLLAGSVRPARRSSTGRYTPPSRGRHCHRAAANRSGRRPST